MNWDLYKLLAESVMTITGYVLFVGAGVTGVVFVVSFCLWLLDRMRKEWNDRFY